MFKQLYFSFVDSDYESEKLLLMVKKFANSESRIVDVGCGYGRNLRMLINAGFENVIGVEINTEIIKENIRRNLPCMSVDEFNSAAENCDVILMSHVIEHFSPFNLKEFIDGYLDRLNVGGYLVVATPLMSDYFYDDFDHVKPFHPAGILAVFGIGKAQVQYYSRNKLTLKDLWFRKSPYRPSYYKEVYLKTRFSRLVQLASFLGALIFRLSIRSVGKKDGWIGIFEKVTTV